MLSRLDGSWNEHPMKVEGGHLHGFESGGVLKLHQLVSTPLLDFGRL